MGARAEGQLPQYRAALSPGQYPGQKQHDLRENRQHQREQDHDDQMPVPIMKSRRVNLLVALSITRPPLPS
jgi:hypothetical protein